MSDGLASVAVFCLIPVGILGLLFVHELGHALPILLAGGRAHVTLGSHDGRTATLGRLSVTLGVPGIWQLLTYGDIRWSGVDSKRVRAAAILGGPAVTVTAVGVLGVVLLRGVDGPSFWVVANLLASDSYRAYQTIVPKTYSQGPYDGMPSDGERFLRLVRS